MQSIDGMNQSLNWGLCHHHIERYNDHISKKKMTDDGSIFYESFLWIFFLQIKLIAVNQYNWRKCFCFLFSFVENNKLIA